MGPSVRRLNNAVDSHSLFSIYERVVLCYARLQRLNRRERFAVLKPPVRSVPRHVVRSRARRFSQARPHASRQSQLFVADRSSGTSDTPERLAFEIWVLGANGDQSPERNQEKEGRV